MKKIARSLSVLIFVVFVSVFPFNAESAQLGGYVGVFGGYTLNPHTSWRGYDFNYDLDVQPTGIFGFKFGFTPTPIKFFSFEFEYSYLNPGVDRTLLTTNGSDFTAIQGDLELHNFMFNAIAKYPTGKIHPYAGVGFGISYFDFSETSTARIEGVDSSTRSSTDDTAFAWQILVGVDIDLTNKLSLDIGWRYFDTESDNDDHGDEHHHDHHRDPTMEYKTSMVTLGLKYKF
jgi:opacity protein-like surface antigen